MAIKNRSGLSALCFVLVFAPSTFGGCEPTPAEQRVLDEITKVLAAECYLLVDHQGEDKPTQFAVVGGEKQRDGTSFWSSDGGANFDLVNLGIGEVKTITVNPNSTSARYNACGEIGCASSPDGENWEPRDTPRQTDEINQLRYGGKNGLAVGPSGTVLYLRKDDDNKFIRMDVGLNVDLNDVTFKENEQALVVGDDGTFIVFDFSNGKGPPEFKISDKVKTDKDCHAASYIAAGTTVTACGDGKGATVSVTNGDCGESKFGPHDVGTTAKPWDVACDNAGVGCGMTTKEGLYRSTDLGFSWELVQLGIFKSIVFAGGSFWTLELPPAGPPEPPKIIEWDNPFKTEIDEIIL